jgi:hypothetical protein
MIQRITERERIPEILEMAGRIKIWNFDIKEMAIYLETNIANPALLVLMDDDRQCFSISSVYRDMVMPYIVIMFAWSDPKAPAVSKAEMEMIKDWARSIGISRIMISVRKGLRAWKRRYGFKFEGVLLTTEVSNG